MLIFPDAILDLEGWVNESLECDGTDRDVGVTHPDTLPVDREGERAHFGGDMVCTVDVGWCCRVGGEGERERNENQAHLERLEHFSKPMSKSLLDATYIVCLVEWRTMGESSTDIDCPHISHCIAPTRNWGSYGYTTVGPL